MHTRQTSRRSLLRFLLGSPLVASLQGSLVFERLLSAGVVHAEPDHSLITTPLEAVNVFDFEPLARANLSAAHYTFLSMGVEDEFTLRANRDAFGRVQMRPRRLVDARDADMSTELLGTKLSCPIVLSPCGAQRAFHPQGELAVARAAKRKDHLQILSTGSSASLEEVVEARRAPIWFQLYTPRAWPITRMQLKDAEQAGCPVVVLTVDQIGGGANRERLHRFRKPSNPACRSCHDSTAEKALYGARDLALSFGLDPMDWFTNMMSLDWSYVDRIRDATTMKLVIKGLMTPEDASLAVEHGVDGIVVSNHGGRAEDIGTSTIEVLPEIVRAVEGRMPILIDSGFRRGTDVFKALAFGAAAVCIGRPYLWGLAAFGQEGVETVLTLLRRELVRTMKEMGATTLQDITPDHVRMTACTAR